MAQSAALASLPWRKRPDEGKDSLDTNVSLLAQSLEDLRLAERVGHALHATGYGALRAIEVSVTARIVRLVGRVPSYHLKQIAQVTAQAVPGAHEVHNGLDVVQSK
jgi:osmotically-inducible protein OsmY